MRKRVIRVIEYEGPAEWVDATLARSLHGTHVFGPQDGTVKAVTIDTHDGNLTQWTPWFPLGDKQ